MSGSLWDQHMWGTPNKTRGGAGRGAAAGAAAAAATGRAAAGAPPPLLAPPLLAPPPPSGAGQYDWLTVNLDDARRTDVMINILTGTRIPAADSVSNRYC